MFTLLAIALAASTPTPTGTADVTHGIFYSGQPAQAVALAGSSAISIHLASWRLTDGTLCQALSLAASRGVAVQVAYNGSSGTNDAQYLATAGIRASGGTVYACSFPRQIANNFFTADGDYTLLGNYYYSPTAVQIGSYSIAVSGTNTASISATTFGTLISGGTITTYLAPLIDDCGIASAAINARPGDCLAARIRTAAHRLDGSRGRDRGRTRQVRCRLRASKPGGVALAWSRRPTAAAIAARGAPRRQTGERTSPTPLPRLHESAFAAGGCGDA